jgi:NADPH:quinone reductase-like Zn-dependent oxidoreductase
VLQLARLSGFSPIITTASLKHTEWLKALGATDVLDRHLDAAALSAEVTKLSKGQPLKYVYDAISAPETQQAGLGLLADGGQIAVLLAPAVASTASRTVVHVLGILREPPNISLLESLYHDHLHNLVKEGAIKVRSCFKFMGNIS